MKKKRNKKLDKYAKYFHVRKPPIPPMRIDKDKRKKTRKRLKEDLLNE